MTNVLLISRGLIPSVRLCGYEQLSLLKEQGKIDFRFSSCRELTPESAGWPDVIFFVRSDSEADVVCAREWRRAGKYLIYVLDDDLLNVPQGISSAAFYHRKNVRKNIRTLMQLCHCMLSPSPLLLEKYGATFERTLRMEEPSLFSAPATSQERNDRVRIGFAGSVDRAGDVDLILSTTIRRLLARYGDRISIEFFGAQPAIAEECGLTTIPYCDSYDAYRERMQSLAWDIGLAPMPDSEFHRYKHYNKFIEYSACGIVGIYSNVPPYRDAIRHGVDGWLCDNTTDAFFDALCRLIDDRKLLSDMRAEVTRLATTTFSLPTVTQELWTSLEDVLTSSTDHTPIPCAKQLRRIDLQERLSAIIAEHGVWKLPFLVIRKIAKKLFRKA